MIVCARLRSTDDYRLPECQNRVEPIPEGMYLRSGYEVVEGKFVRRERDHEHIIGYDDVNQLSWYAEGIAHIALQDKRFMQFDRIDWNRAFFKTYYEKRSFGHLLVNFNRIWIIHISMYFFYTAYNSPAVYAIDGKLIAAVQWSAVALGGAVATLIMIFATLAEFSYIPTTWNNTASEAKMEACQTACWLVDLMLLRVSRHHDSHPSESETATVSPHRLLRLRNLKWRILPNSVESPYRRWITFK
ncbi:hypothetical protein C8R47DRAFT_961745 [Mycena vitilis]|nr:hypothetical protein C8R47DRAFT_961745 [Mycena vitilis]